MKTSHQKGIGGIGLIVAAVVIGLVVIAGVYVARSRDASQQPVSEQEKAKAFDEAAKAEIRAKDFRKEGITTFKHHSFIGEEKKNEIMAKIVGPMIYYNNEVMRTPLKEVTVDINDARLSYEDDHFILSYKYVSDRGGEGFMFGPGGRIHYYQPALCDPGGCQPYPEGLKDTFPANYQAYLTCQAAEGNKEKQQELGCSL